MTVTVPYVLLDDGLPAPSQAHEADAGWDLYARTPTTLQPGERVAVPTGLAVAIPDGYVGLVTPRSGWARRAGLGMVNAPGVIDAGFRGEVHVLLINHDPVGAIDIQRADRIAQLVILPIPAVNWHRVASLPDSHRGEFGFGSSGQ